MRKKPDAHTRLSEMIRLSRRCCDITRQVVAAESLQENDTLLSVLEERAELLARISDIGQGLETTTKNGQKILTGLPPEQKETVNGLVRDLDQSMKQIQKADQELGDKLRGELGDLGVIMDRVRQGHTALKRYAPSKVSEPRCVNRRG